MSNPTRSAFDRRYDEYAQFLAANPELVHVPSDAGLQVLTDRGDVLRAEEAAKQRATRHGNPETWAEVGVAYTDQYVSIIRDAVRFPNGDLGTYIRILQRKEKLPGVAVLPTCEGKIVLIEHYRHATRDWHLEIPRGFGETASPETNARLEVKEELGTECLSLEPLGTIHTNSGLLSEHVHLFFARVQSCSITDKKEPIRAIKLLGLDDVKTLLCAGQITDSFTVAAMAFAEWRGFLTQL